MGDGDEVVVGGAETVCACETAAFGAATGVMPEIETGVVAFGAAMGLGAATGVGAVSDGAGADACTPRGTAGIVAAAGFAVRSEGGIDCR